MRLLLLLLLLLSGFYSNSQTKTYKKKMIETISKNVYDSIFENDHNVLSFLVRDRSTRKRYIISSFSNKRDILFSDENETEIKKYKNEEIFFKNIDESIISKLEHPLFKYRFFMSDIDTHKDKFINELFAELQLDKNEDILKTDFDIFNIKLIECGFENLYKNYYLHLIIFSIEYLKKINNNEGKLVLKHNSNYPLSFQPSYIDSKNKDYYFSLNINLARELQARFLSEDYAIDQNIDLSKPFNYKNILNLSLDYRDVIGNGGN